MALTQFGTEPSYLFQESTSELELMSQESFVEWNSSVSLSGYAGSLHSQQPLPCVFCIVKPVVWYEIGTPDRVEAGVL